MGAEHRKRSHSVSSSSTDTSAELRREKKERRAIDKKQEKKLEKAADKLEKAETKLEKVDKRIHKVENEIGYKVDKKISKAEKKIEKVEDKLEHKVDKKLSKVEDAVEDKVVKGIYSKLKYRFRRDGCLFVNGSDAFLSAWAKAPQVVEAGEAVEFNGVLSALNVEVKPGMGEFHVCRDGIYQLEFVGQFDQSGVIVLAVNNAAVQPTITAVAAGEQTVMQAILPIKKDSCVQIWNYDLSNGAVLTTSALAFGATNATFTLARIAPWTKKFGGCCPLPPLPKYGEYDSDCSSVSSRSSCSSKSSRSSCSSKSSRSKRPKCPKEKCPKDEKKCRDKKKHKKHSRRSTRSSRSSSSSSCSSRSSGYSTASKSSSDYSVCDKKRGCRK
jgi:hypothetical protein